MSDRRPDGAQAHDAQRLARPARGIAVSVRTASKLKLKPPTTSADGHESRRWREGTAAPRDAEISQLAPPKHRLVFFNPFVGRAVFVQLHHVRRALIYTSGSHEQATQHQLLDGIGIGARSVEDRYA